MVEPASGRACSRTARRCARSTDSTRRRFHPASLPRSTTSPRPTTWTRDAHAGSIGSASWRSSLRGWRPTTRGSRTARRSTRDAPGSGSGPRWAASHSARSSTRPTSVAVCGPWHRRWRRRCSAVPRLRTWPSTRESAARPSATQTRAHRVPSPSGRRSMPSGPASSTSRLPAAPRHLSRPSPSGRSR